MTAKDKLIGVSLILIGIGFIALGIIFGGQPTAVPNNNQVYEEQQLNGEEGTTEAEPNVNVYTEQETLQNESEEGTNRYIY